MGSSPDASLLVGRRAELRTISRHVHRAARSSGSLILISGGPGLGKSRLIHETLLRAEAKGFRCCSSVCSEGFVAPALSAWRRVLETCGVSVTCGDTPNRFALYRRMTEGIASAAAHAPLSIAVDDLQWADRDSLQFARFLLADLDHIPVLLVCAYRDDGSDSGFSAIIGSLLKHDCTVALHLNPVPAEGARKYLSARPTVSDDEAEDIIALAEGVPLFLKALADWPNERSALLDGLRGRSAPPAHLEEFRSLVEYRMANMDTNVRTVLVVASLLGRSVSLNALRVAAGVSWTTALDAIFPPGDPTYAWVRFYEASALFTQAAEPAQTARALAPLLSGEIGPPSLRYKAHRLIIMAYFADGDKDSEIRWTTRAVEVAREIGDYGAADRMAAYRQHRTLKGRLHRARTPFRFDPASRRTTVGRSAKNLAAHNLLPALRECAWDTLRTLLAELERMEPDGVPLSGLYIRSCVRAASSNPG